ncbi:MAG: hypothetical protein PHV02_05240 [Rhodocyclaceae bacterium]|nr:hypothetical protein [Rhodocyclaceae bacterium]
MVQQLSESVLNLLSEKMYIDTQHLEEKIQSEPLIAHSNYSIIAINELGVAVINGKSRHEVNKIFIGLNSSSICEHLYDFLDSVRHALSSFAEGGIHSLYVYQANEAWYPKVVLRHVIQPNDIHTLKDIIPVFRGCDLSEFENQRFGQAWSTSVDVAREFANQHYLSQHWFNKKNRTVLAANIKKYNVYYSNQQKHEREIALNTEGLIAVKVAT